MWQYIIESWHIFLDSLGELTGTKGVVALVFLFAVFLVFFQVLRRVWQLEKIVKRFLGIQSDVSPK